MIIVNEKKMSLVNRLHLASAISFFENFHLNKCSSHLDYEIFNNWFSVHQNGFSHLTQCKVCDEKLLLLIKYKKQLTRKEKRV